jgi:endonuclease YncB( thermonuclease family)
MVETRPQSFTLRRFWVVDGDTIQDNATGTIYRLENIDCPETADRAKCYRERTMGERAKFETIRLLKGAAIITVHPTGKIDPYGRSIASIDVDGQDFGQLMIARGFARPWRGVREDWCGPNGGLARMAEACSAKFHRETCGGRAGVSDQGGQASAETPKEPFAAG